MGRNDHGDDDENDDGLRGRRPPINIPPPSSQRFLSAASRRSSKNPGVIRPVLLVREMTDSRTARTDPKRARTDLFRPLRSPLLWWLFFSIAASSRVPSYGQASVVIQFVTQTEVLITSFHLICTFRSEGEAEKAKIPSRACNTMAAPYIDFCPAARFRVPLLRDWFPISFFSRPVFFVSVIEL